MNTKNFASIRWWLALPVLCILLLCLSFALPPRCLSLAEDSPPSDDVVDGQQAFWDFFGPDGVNECIQTNFDHLPVTYADDQAILTTVWETVGNGRINRKYLNGLVAFCYDEELAFPNGAIYEYSPADQAAVYGQVAAIAQRFGQSGVDNAQWWNECQVAIWAVRAGCNSYDSAAAFARSYCADRKITDPATVEDYAYIAGTLVSETAGASGTAYLYQSSDPANQRILTYLAVWPDSKPTYPSPKYDQVSATEDHTASRSHSIAIDRKSASITGETLAGAVFEVYEADRLVGTITTDAQGKGSCQWPLYTSASASITKEYCSNYDKLDPEVRKTITGYTNREDAYAAARSEARQSARQQAEAQANVTRTVTIRETQIPAGFSATADSSQTVTLSGDDSAILSITNAPWSAILRIDKVDDATGETIPADTIFTLYEWNGSDYEVSPHYQILRRDDGIYTVISTYEDSQTGHLYYTQQNQGRFGLAELKAPDGYYLDPEPWYFVIRQDGQIIYGHNASPDDYEIHDPTKFSNRPKPQPLYDTISATGEATAFRTHQLSLDSKTAAVTGEPLSGAVFQIYEDGLAVGTITTDTLGQGSCQWQLTETSSATVVKQYCSNYDQLEPEEQATVIGFVSRDAALAAAQAEADLQAQAQANTLADQTRVITLEEIAVPLGFLSSTDPLPEISLTGDESTSFSAINTPWSATLLIHKADAITGETIPADTTFTLYEWNGSDYEVSPHYQIARREDGIYTAISTYEDGEPGCLYYTQKNQGKFALVETIAPRGYVADEEMFSFQITEDGQTIWAHNATPDRYTLSDDTKFLNQAVTGTVVITKTGDYLTDATLPDFGKTASSDNHLFGTVDSADFQYTSLPVSGASFAIYAAEDILLPGKSQQIATYRDISLYQGTLVATVTTDNNGIAFLDQLPLGTYEIREISSGQGDLLLDPTVTTVALTYKDQFTSVVVDDTTHYHNQRQKISLHLIKEDPEQRPLSGATFGLYTSEHIYAWTWDDATEALIVSSQPLIPADTLLEIVCTDADGQAIFLTDLPCGKYNVRELTPPDGYQPSDEVYAIDASYTGNDGEAVLSFSHTFINHPNPPQIPQEPSVPTSSGAPTGDDSPLLLSCCCFLSSLLVIISLKTSQRKSKNTYDL